MTIIVISMVMTIMLVIIVIVIIVISIMFMIIIIVIIMVSSMAIIMALRDSYYGYDYCYIFFLILHDDKVAAGGLPGRETTTELNNTTRTKHMLHINQRSHINKQNQQSANQPTNKRQQVINKRTPRKTYRSHGALSGLSPSLHHEITSAIF